MYIHDIDDFIGAIRDCDKAIELNPNYAKAYYNRGIAKIKLGRKEEGCFDLNKAGVMGFNKAIDVKNELYK